MLEKELTLTIEMQRIFLKNAIGQSYEDQFRFVLQTGFRTIPLTDEAISILKRQKEKHKEIKVIPIEWSEYVFLCRKGTPIKNSTYDTALFKICDKAGIPRFSMHVLRHTFATRCIEAGMKPKILQMLLGHSSLSITMGIYVRITEEEKSKEMDLISQALMVI